MKKVAIIHSKRTKAYAEKLGKNYPDVFLIEISGPPKSEGGSFGTYLKKIIAVGGGSVIDTAKLMARPKRCIVIPTTASGACATPYATVWDGKVKKSVTTRKPILRMKYDTDIRLSYKVKTSTFFDCLSHAIESLWSKDSTILSRYYARKALKLLAKYIQDQSNYYTLVEAGNYAGKAIAIAKTNVVHAISYPLTIEYGINHGLACGLILPFVLYGTTIPIGKYFGGKSNNAFAMQLESYFPYFLVDIANILSDFIIDLALQYKKIDNSKLKITQAYLQDVFKAMKWAYHYEK